MKRSIRWKFTVTFISLMTLTIVATWCINTFWLEDYYLSYKMDVLEQAYNSIDTIMQQEEAKGGDALGQAKEAVPDVSQNLSGVITQLRDTSNITLLIYDSIKDQTLVSSAGDIEVLKERVSRYIVGKNTPEHQILEEHDNYMIQKTYDPRTKTFFLESWGFFSDNGTMFIMTTPLASIQESAAISNRFLMYVGMAVILAAGVILYFITKKITAPIHNLSELSEKMSNLDFEAKYQEEKHSAEEIDTLGNSMNVLSDKLKDTIGALKSANNELHKDIEEKIQIDEMRKEFIANVSHELKTPIALVQGYAEGLTEGMAEEKESRDYYCEVIMDEANKMNKMVKQLLTLTALEFGSEQTSMERFNLTDLIDGVLSSMKLLFEQKEITAVFDCSKEVYVWADEFKIEEVVTNYLNNAVNHADGQREIRVSIEQKEQEVKVSVFNTGNQIPENDIPNLWTKFYKVDKARTRIYGGSGIGLSIVKAIMEAHHKTYGVENVEGGVKFWFMLDCSDVSKQTENIK
ncbi:MAG: HAMP domain-containing sensor histidine kinase [Clostridium sp.]